MYADNMTDSMNRAITETERRRKLQSEYNKEHGIVPKTIIKTTVNTLQISSKPTMDAKKKMTKQEKLAEIERLTELMKVATDNLDFEKAIEIRDYIAKLKK